jgi:hypothetical protein
LPEDIAHFKKEYREPVLVNGAKDGNTRNDGKRKVNPPLEKRRRGRPPKHKVKAEQHHGESVLSSIQPSSPSSGLLAIDPTPPISQNGSYSSSFMRPIAPKMHLPSSFRQHQVPVSLTSMPDSYGRPGLLNPSVSPWALDYNDFPGIVHCNSSQECSKRLTGLDLTTPSYRTTGFSLAHQPAAYSATGDENHPTMNYVRNPPDKAALHPNVQDESSPFCRVGHSRRPIARHVPYPPRTTQWPARPSAASVNNNSPSLSTTSHSNVAQLAKLPLFTRNVLSVTPPLTDAGLYC